MYDVKYNLSGSVYAYRKRAGGAAAFKKSGYDQIWLTLAAAFGTGVLIMGWATYMTAWAASEAGAVHPLIYANAVVMPVAALIVLILYWKRYRKAGSFKGILGTGMITERRLFRKEAVFFGALLVFLTWIMFYVFLSKTECCTVVIRFTGIMHRIQR